MQDLSNRILLLLSVWLLSVSPSALAATYYVRFCSWVTTDYIDNAAGDVWTTAGLYAPGRGFAIKVENDTLDTVVWEDWADESGTYEGCTDELALDSAYQYDVKVVSKAKLGNITVKSYDDIVTPELVTNLSANNFVPSSDQRYDMSPIPGDTESRWNFLSVVALALVTEDAGLSTVTLDLYKDGTSAVYNETSPPRIRLPDGYDRKFVVVHELGHFLSLQRSGGSQSDGSAALDGCNGNAGIVQKEYQSFAATEGIASFYSAYILNDHGPADDCEWQPAVGINWDLDGNPANIDVLPTGMTFCHGDPWPGNPDPDDRDWLRDMVLGDDDNVDGVQCTGSSSPTDMVNRSTEYDWMRYLWELVTVEDVPISAIWDIWAGADPATWNGDDGGLSGDFPIERWADSASYEGYATEHGNAESHGLNH